MKPTGFDWNGNGKHDSFDDYMNMKIAMKVSEELKHPHKPSRRSPTKINGISMGGKPLYDARKDSNGVTIFKCALVVALCIAGLALPIALDFGSLGTALCLFGAVAAGVAILKNVWNAIL